MTDAFHFLDVPHLADGELELLCVERRAPEHGRDWAPSYHFIMCSSGRPIGKIDLRIGNTRTILLFGGHIGYWVHPNYRGRHFAERACRLLLPLAKRHGLETLWITCNPANQPSRRTCERLGATLVEVIPLPADNHPYQDGDPAKCRYRLDLV